MDEICNEDRTFEDCLNEAIHKITLFIANWSEMNMSQKETSKLYSQNAMQFAQKNKLNLQRIGYYNSKIQLMEIYK